MYDLDYKDYCSLKQIGEGKEAKVYVDPNNSNNLLKLYKKKLAIYDPIDINEEIDDFDTKVFDKLVSIVKNYNDLNILPKYVDSEGVKIYTKSAIKLAINRQELIKLTTLPRDVIYLNNRFVGCVIKRHKLSFQIHKIWNLLPKSAKINIMFKLKTIIDELVYNYIYPIDLNNKPTDKLYSHSNILVSYNLTPHLIDLDGNSTLYYEYKNSMYEEMTYNSLARLFLELITDLEDDYTFDEEINEYNRINNSLSNNSLNNKLLNKIYSNNITSENLDEFLSNLSHSWQRKVKKY